MLKLKGHSLVSGIDLGGVTPQKGGGGDFFEKGPNFGAEGAEKF